MSESVRVWGWTLEQWVKAVDYQFRFEPRLPERPTTIHALGDAARGAEDSLRYLLEVQQFWRTRRRDQPLEVKLILP